MRWLLLIILSFFFVACISASFPHDVSPVGEYDVWIDPNFSSEQYRIIVQSFNEWEKETNKTVKFYRVDHAPLMGRPLITIWRSSHKEIYSRKSVMKDNSPGTTIGLTMYHGYDSDVLLDYDMGQHLFHGVVLHEIGHCLDLPHVEDAKYDGETIMRPITNQFSSYLTCLDITNFCKLWKCSPNEMPLCKSSN